MAGARNYAKRIHTLYNSVLLADFSILWRYYAPPLIGGALSDAFVWRLSDVCLPVCRVHRA